MPTLPPSIHRIAIPVPFPIQSVNAWLLQGSAPALIDCGIGNRVGYQTLHDGLTAAKQDPAALRLYVTHGHVDHAGNAARLRKDHGTRLHAPPDESPFIETFRRDAQKRNDDYMAALMQHGLPADVAARMRQDSDAIDDYLEDCPIEGDAPDGETVLLGDSKARIERTAGHTPGSTCFVLEDENAILTGDTLLETITSNALEIRDIDRGAQHAYVQTLDSLRRYIGMTVLPGHHDSFDLTEAILEQHLDRHNRRAAKIHAALDRPRSAWELMPIVFPHLSSDAQYFMAMAELIGHLNALHIEGRAAPRDEAGIRRFQRT